MHIPNLKDRFTAVTRCQRCDPLSGAGKFDYFLHSVGETKADMDVHHKTIYRFMNCTFKLASFEQKTGIHSPFADAMSTGTDRECHLEGAAV